MYCNLLATTQAEIIDNLFEDLEEITPDDGDGITNWLGSLQTSGSTIGTVATAENSTRLGRNSSNTMVLTSQKALFATERAKQEAAADRLYRNSEQGAWNTYLTGVHVANTTYLGSVKTAENTYKSASDAAESAFDTTTITALSSLKHSGRNLTCLYYNATENPSVLTAYSNTENGEPTLEIPEQIDTVPGFEYEKMFEIFFNEYGEDGLALLKYALVKGYEVEKSPYDWLSVRNDWWLDKKKIRIGNTDYCGAFYRSESNAAAQLKEALESIVEQDRLQEIANNCIREDYPLQPWYVQSYRTATAVLIVSDITGFVKTENAITGQTILNESMTTGERALSGTMGAVEGLVTIIPGAKFGTTLGKTALKKVGVSAASVPFSKYLLQSVTCNLGNRVTAKLLQTAAGQGLIKALQIPQIRSKLDYMFGLATGEQHNVERSVGMLKELERIGFLDNAENRAYLAQYLKRVFRTPDNIVSIQSNGCIAKESLLMGRYGAVKLHTIWRDNELISIIVKGTSR